MRRLDAVLVLFSAVGLAACQAGSDSTSALEAKRAGGNLPVPKPNPISVPAGATLPLVLETAISSETSRSGDVVVARLAEDVRVGEKVVIPAGSEVRGRVTAAVPSGRVKTRARLAFNFDTLVIKTREHAIDTGSLDITADDTHKKDAATVGIGAGAGAIVGAIVDGKKGAGIGALIGGAAGTGVALTDTGKEVKLGSGTRVTVRLTQEARL
jgi:hypothetical protein